MPWSDLSIHSTLCVNDLIDALQQVSTGLVDHQPEVLGQDFVRMKNLVADVTSNNLLVFCLQSGLAALYDDGRKITDQGKFECEQRILQ